MLQWIVKKLDPSKSRGISKRNGRKISKKIEVYL
jgi:hypothetical protein